MIDLPPGDSPDDLIVSIADLWRLVGVTPHIFTAKPGRAKRQSPGAVSRWLKLEPGSMRVGVKKAAKAAAVQRLRNFFAHEEAGAAIGRKMSVPITDNAPAGTREGSNTHQSSLDMSPEPPVTATTRTT